MNWGKTAHGLVLEEQNKIDSEKGFVIFKQEVLKLDLDMKPLQAEYTFDRTKIIFYYTAEDRVDFRELLKDFLDPSKGNIFGFSAKSWKASNGKEFMKSSVLQKMLNPTFGQTDSKGQRHSW